MCCLAVERKCSYSYLKSLIGSESPANRAKIILCRVILKKQCKDFHKTTRLNHRILPFKSLSVTAETLPSRIFLVFCCFPDVSGFFVDPGEGGGMT